MGSCVATSRPMPNVCASSRTSAHVQDAGQLRVERIGAQARDERPPVQRRGGRRVRLRDEASGLQAGELQVAGGNRRPIRDSPDQCAVYPRMLRLRCRLRCGTSRPSHSIPKIPDLPVRVGAPLRGRGV
jgi:hypothetical protein